MTSATTQLLRRYVDEARPHGERQELFLTRTAPFRSLSPGALYDLVQRLFQRLDIPSRRRPSCLTSIRARNCAGA